MKTKLMPIFAIAILLLSCANSTKAETVFPFSIANEGKGPITSKTITGNFDEIAVATSIDAEIYKSNEEKVEISAPSDIIDRIMVENKGGLLKIYVKSKLGVFSTKNVKAKIYAKDFTKLMANSSGSISVKDTFKQDKTTVEVSSSGDISGNLEANELIINANSSGDFSGKIWAVKLEVSSSSSGDIKISGKAKNAKISSNSSGDVIARDLQVENADLDASSSGDIVVSVSKILNANASSSGEITVFKLGNLQTNIRKSSGGDVYLK